MTIHQLSVFIENKSGTLVKVLKLLKNEGIQLIASTIADTAEYGICRIICSEPTRAYDVLKAAGVAVSLADVFAIELDDEPGRAADAIEIFAEAGISIAYLYSFLLRGKGVLVFRTDNAQAAADAIKSHGLKSIPESDLYKLV
ncbi:MAG: amino acid-binding protein [Bacteroidales bacterium]|nr:amino acid-binding protein [Bacteroidales bacterium]